MKKRTKLLGVAGIVLATVLIAADHIDAPDVAGGTSDITDYYAFQGTDTDNLVFVANVQGLIAPGATADAAFDENTLIEFNIDNDGDHIEDLVIQAIPEDGVMNFYGPVTPSSTGLNSVIETEGTMGSVDITAYGTDAITTTTNGMMYFAGPRDDPFFFDFGQYGEIIAGNATAFNTGDDAVDTFAGSNVMSVVIEVPKSLLGGSGTLNTWVETKQKQ